MHCTTDAREHNVKQILDRSGVPTAHLRVNFFSEWMLYTAAEIVGQPLTTPEQFIEQHRHLLT
jgi:hypothetical protein